VSVVLRRGEVSVTPVFLAACAAVKAEPNESTAAAAIKMLRVRIKFLPMFRRLNRSINAERQVAVPLSCPLRAKSGNPERLLQISDEHSSAGQNNPDFGKLARLRINLD
jgi:hypothetical protein